MKSNIRKVELNSSFLPFINVCTYSTFDMYEMWYYMYEEMPRWIEEKERDNSKFLKDVCEYTLEELEDVCLNDLSFYIDSDVSTLNTHSPKFYNFSTDSFTVDVNIDVARLSEFVKGVVKSDLEICEDFIEYNWETRSGFLSFMPQSIKEVLELDIDNDEDVSKLLAFAINIIVIKEVDYINDMWMYVMENITGNSSLYDYAKFQLSECPDQPHSIITEIINSPHQVYNEAMERGLISGELISDLVGAGYSYSEQIEKVLLKHGIEYDFDYTEIPIDDVKIAMAVALIAQNVESILD